MAMFTVSSFSAPTHDAETDTCLIRLWQMHKMCVFCDYDSSTINT